MNRASTTLGQRVGGALPIAVIAITMLLGGVSHLVAPEQFMALVPRPLPPHAVLYITGVVQLAIGGSVLWSRTRRAAGFAFAVLCLGYLPLHLWDFVRPDPVFTPPVAASIRVAVQLVFIATGFTLWRRRL
ncbi:MAG: hypothetical protein MUF00_14770 [Gemmatimonadaceae bacterium]|jgi:uncharacterized membrane protein|nr:hypothetical protein [Gemmatimonadaceae bacterium]